MNHVVLVGLLTSAPQVRTLASGSDVWSLELSTTTDDGTRCTVPVVLVDPAAEPVHEVGDAVVVVGGVRRRFFHVAAGTQSRTEVVAASITSLRDPRKWRRLLRQQAERLGAVAAGEVPSV